MTEALHSDLATHSALYKYSHLLIVTSVRSELIIFLVAPMAQTG